MTVALATRSLLRALHHRAPPTRGVGAAPQILLPVKLGQRGFFFGEGNGNKDGGSKGGDGGKGESAEVPGDKVSNGDTGSSKNSETPATPTAPTAGRAEGSRKRSKRSDENASGAIVPVATSGGLQGGTPPFEPLLLALPLARRPLFPRHQQIVMVTQPELMKAISQKLDKGSPYLATFLSKKDGASGSMVDETVISSEGGDEHSSPEGEFYKQDPLEVLHHVGTRARILQAAPFVQNSPSGQPIEGIQMMLNGVELIKLDKVLKKGPPLQVQVSKLQLPDNISQDELRGYHNELMQMIRQIMQVNPQFREHASMIHQVLERMEQSDPHAVAHFAAHLSTASGEELQQVLEAQQPLEKLQKALVLLKKELELATIQQKIATQIEEKVNTAQREFMLREQLKMIKKELGEDKSDGTDKLLEKFKARLEGKDVPKDAKEAIDSELEKFSHLAKESQEYQMTRNYLDWLTLVPWGAHSVDTLSLQKAKEVLDRDHHGLTDVKERILELIAVGALRGSVQGKILCFVGPPGVGKTSIGRSIAEALGREFFRFSVGGLYDVAEIKGHRRTYVGAMPGKVIQALKKVQKGNPLILIDEVDKIGRGHQGDPASALLELLDPSQNSAFLDHYLDVPVDCSKILFVCTANVTDTIPGPLLDRMEVIRLSGYDLQEKLKIAEDYLVPSSMREVGLWPQLEATKVEEEKKKEEEEDAVETISVTPAAKPEEEKATNAAPEAPAPPREQLRPLPKKATIDTAAVESLIRWYCREAGVRNLQKHIEKICRKMATKWVETSDAAAAALAGATAPTAAPVAAPEGGGDAAAGTPPVEKSGIASAVEQDGAELHVTADDLSSYVGKPIFTSDRLYDGELPLGTITGLAWTAMGGSVLYVEATALPRVGSSKAATPALNVTGQLGSVMKESSQIALLVARQQLGSRAPLERRSFFEEHDLHLHCPEGATPKDGPSAGVTMTTALLSLGLGQPARADLAMTGEVSLNGKVLPVGGIKEKTIAARRAGCKALVFPQGNRRDFEELPDYLREGLEVHYAGDYRDVFAVAFPKAAAAFPDAAAAEKGSRCGNSSMSSGNINATELTAQSLLDGTIFLA